MRVTPVESPLAVVESARQAEAMPVLVRSYRAGRFYAGIALGFALGLAIAWIVVSSSPSPTDSLPASLPESRNIADPRIPMIEVLPPPQFAREEAPFPSLVADRRGEQPNPVPGVSVIRLNRPNETFNLDPIAEGNQIKLVGKVGKLILNGLADGARLDASELECGYASVKGPIEEASTLLLRVPNGNVHFSRPIQGGSKVDIHAPGGYVSFARPNTNSDGAKISGGSQVRVMARSVVFVGHIVGAKTLVDVTFTSGGSMRFYQIADSAKLHYRLDDPNSLAPRVTPGQVLGEAECKRLD
jgi:hypothetical protein